MLMLPLFRRDAFQSRAASQARRQAAGEVPAPERRQAINFAALGDRAITVEVKWIAARGEYASWRATRATGDFDLRTFEVRAYPVDKVPELRPGMSAYTDWRARQ